MGALGGDEESVGLLPRAVAQIFERIVNDESGADFAVSCSYLEIYKEVVRDLLQPTTKPGGLAIREDTRNRARGIYVEDLTEVYVMGEADVLECLSCGNANRVVGTTLMNSQSSRSHALLTIKVQQKMPDGSTKVSKLNVADLAGSEKVQALQAELDDERQEKSAVTSALKDREEELKLLFETLAGFQVLHGVQPICSRDSKANIDQLRRQLLAAEVCTLSAPGEQSTKPMQPVHVSSSIAVKFGPNASQELALEKEMGMADEDASRVLVAALRAQISEQDRRIRELEHSAEQAAHAAAAQQEVAQLKEQLRELIQSKLVQVGRAAAGGLCTRTSGDSLATDECFMAKEVFGQHLLRKANPHCSSPTKPSDRRRSHGGKLLNPRMSFLGEPAGMSLLAQAEAADFKKKLQLETSRCQALQRKVDCLSQQLAKVGGTWAGVACFGGSSGGCRTYPKRNASFVNWLLDQLARLLSERARFSSSATSGTWTCRQRDVTCNAAPSRLY
ncbi:hypothetical protein AB1Y20_017793 [Prymnesium parvum]|uniref:Kinesin motor domain-containing protein n=1 Tax=Prymnesium parvum TaxID=97485 RepID=A0AB34JLJ5_PRYPA